MALTTISKCKLWFSDPDGSLSYAVVAWWGWWWKLYMRSWCFENIFFMASVTYAICMVGTARDFFAAPCLGGLTPDKGVGCLYDINRNLYGNIVSYLRYWNVYGETAPELICHLLWKKARTRKTFLVCSRLDIFNFHSRHCRFPSHAYVEDEGSMQPKEQSLQTTLIWIINFQGLVVHWMTLMFLLITQWKHLKYPKVARLWWSWKLLIWCMSKVMLRAEQFKRRFERESTIMASLKLRSLTWKRIIWRVVIGCVVENA